ncbi:MAG: HDOD domain-containing protein [Opitutaceae bacterium]|nr:HDOD domain-containing protein [Opitutaceae bacterium]
MRVANSFAATPRIMVALGRLLRDPGVALDDVAALLRQDSTLSARLLRIANSAAFAPGEPVASIQDAAALIGLKDVHRLVGAVAVDQFSLRDYPLYGFTGPELRGNSLLVALLMEELAASTREDPAAAYSAGLFRSVGKLALAKLADESVPVAPFQPADTFAPLESWEKHTFGVTSNGATAAILKEWHFPSEVTAAIADHFYPAAHHHPLAGLLNLSGRLADEMGHGLLGESRYWLPAAESARVTGLDPAIAQRAGERALIAFERVNRAMG